MMISVHACTLASTIPIPSFHIPTHPLTIYLSMPPSSLAPTAAASPLSPLRSVSLGPQPGNTSHISASQTLLQHNSGAATPPRKPIALGGGPGTAGSSSGSTTPVPGGGGAGKTRARDLLRKHYGLGVGPPPAREKSSPDDPMDLSACFALGGCEGWRS